MMVQERHRRSDLEREEYFYLRGKLPQTELYVIGLYYFEDRSLQETAQISRNSENECYRIVDKAIRILEKRMRKGASF